MYRIRPAILQLFGIKSYIELGHVLRKSTNALRVHWLWVLLFFPFVALLSLRRSDCWVACLDGCYRGCKELWIGILRTSLQNCKAEQEFSTWVSLHLSKSRIAVDTWVKMLRLEGLQVTNSKTLQPVSKRHDWANHETLQVTLSHAFFFLLPYVWFWSMFVRMDDLV